MLLLSFVLLLEGIWQVNGDRTIQPCGPKLCEAFCQSNKDCSAKIFDEIQLSCRLILKTHDLNHSCQVSREGKFIQSKNSSYSKKQGHSCSPSHKRRFKKSCKEKNLQEVERLVGHGLLDVNCRFEEASTLVMIAASYNWTTAFDYLVQQNCDLTTNNSNSMTVLHFASGKSEEITRKLIDDHCSDIECRDSSGQTPLTHAAKTEYVRIAQLLVDRGADVRVVDKVNRNILHVASEEGNVNMVKYILSLNVTDIDGKGEMGTTALMYAIRKDHLPVVKVLLQYHADVTKLDGYKDNVLHLAVSYGQLDMVMVLASLKETSGFENRRNIQGFTPFRFAELLGKADITSFLKSRTN